MNHILSYCLGNPYLLTAMLIVGLVLLVKGADWLVDGASALAKHFGISDLVIGLTVVAFGTSMPEFMVNMVSVAEGSTDLAITNILGSNIINTFVMVREMARTMEALQYEIDGGEKQKNLLHRSGELMAEVIGQNLSTKSVETEIELNLALIKIKHKVTRKEDD